MLVSWLLRRTTFVWVSLSLSSQKLNDNYTFPLLDVIVISKIWRVNRLIALVKLSSYTKIRSHLYIFCHWLQKLKIYFEKLRKKMCLGVMYVTPFSSTEITSTQPMLMK